MLYRMIAALLLQLVIMLTGLPGHPACICFPRHFFSDNQDRHVLTVYMSEGIQD
jgi:hypothetical protein